MFDIGSFFKKIIKADQKELLVETTSKDAAKERLHIVLMQDRANVSADFLELMKQEIVDVIKKYIVVDEEQIDVRLTNQENEDGTTGAPSLYANIPILNIRNDIKGGILEQNSEEVSNEQKADNVNINSENYDEEYDDDDVTFDDLLKAAEEEEKRKNMSLENKETETAKSETEEVKIENSETDKEIPDENNSENVDNKATKEEKTTKKANTKKQSSKNAKSGSNKKKSSSGKKRTLKR